MKNIARPPSALLRIAVVGVGAIGSTFAYHLARAGHAVTAVARPGSKRLSQLQLQRGVVLKSGERADLRIADALDEQCAYDLVLVTVLAHQVAAVLPALQRSSAAAVQFMFNTFDPDPFADVVGRQRCSFGMPFVMSRLDDQGKLDTRINPGQKTLHGDVRWADLFCAAGVPSTFEPEMSLWLRCHVPICIAMESICVAGQRRGGGASWSESRVAARGLHSGFTIVKALGYSLYPASKSRLGSWPVALLACMLWAISRVRSFRELLATGLAECCALADALAAAASNSTPALASEANGVLAMKPSRPD